MRPWLLRVAVLATTLSFGVGCGSGDGGSSHGDPFAAEVGGFRDAALVPERSGALAVGGWGGLDEAQRPLIALLDDSGQPRWTASFAPIQASGTVETRGAVNALAAADDGTVIAAGRLVGDDDQTQGVVAAFAPGGRPLWQSVAFPPGASEVTALAIDGDAVYAAGWAFLLTRTDVTGDLRAVLLSRLDLATGEVVWHDLAASDLDPNQLTTAFAVDVAGDGRVGVAGTASTPASTADWFAGVWSADGELQWSDLADGSGGLGGAGVGDFDVARKARFDASGDLYVIGDVMEQGVGADIQAVRYALDGRRRWTRHSGSDPGVTTASLDRGTALAVSGARVWVGGTIERASDGTVLPEAVVAQLDADTGAPLWTADLDDLSQSGEDVADVAIAPDGETLVAGSLSSSGVGKDLVIHQAGGDGTPRWTTAVERPGTDTLDDDHARRVLVDEAGEVFAVGTLALPDGRPGWAAVALDASGRLRWSYPAESVTQVTP